MREQGAPFSGLVEFLAAHPSANVRHLRGIETDGADPRAIGSIVAAMFAGVAAGRDELSRRVESEVRASVISVLGLPAGSACVLTGSGTESILCALLAARRAHRAAGRTARHISAASSVHPSVRKAAALLDLGIAFGHAVDAETVAVIASAPAWASGAYDSTEPLRALARSHGAQFHIDACIGGFLLPFLTNPESAARYFAGADSIAVDLHKFGYAPVSLSAICFADPKLAKAVEFTETDWDGPPYWTDSIAGDRPFWPIAAAWAVMNSLGRAGYRELAALLMQRRARVCAAAETGGHGVSTHANSPIVCIRPRAPLEGIPHLRCGAGEYARLRIDPLLPEREFQQQLQRLAQSS